MPWASPVQRTGMRDRDKDGKISQSEAVDGMKANFSLIDSNGDGGIDLAELTAVLKVGGCTTRNIGVVGQPAETYDCLVGA